MDGYHPGVRAAGRRFPRAIPAHQQLRGRGVEFAPGIRLPVRPFPGTIGVAPAETGLHSVVPPREVGGNMDIRDLTRGSTLPLPGRGSGALFSFGDTHAAAGDAEVGCTAVESPRVVRP